MTQVIHSHIYSPNTKYLLYTVLYLNYIMLDIKVNEFSVAKLDPKYMEPF